MTDKLLFATHVAERLCCSRSYVYELIKEGELKAIQHKGYIRIPESSVIDFLERRTLDPQDAYALKE